MKTSSSLYTKYRILLFGILFLHFPTNLFGSNLFNIPERETIIDLTSNTFIFKDSSQSITISEILNDKNRIIFQKNNNSRLYHSHGTIPIWYKITIKNTEPHFRLMMLVIKNTTIPYLNVYIQNHNGIKEYEPTGSDLPFTTRNIAYSHFCFELPFRPNEIETIYIKITPKGDALSNNILLYESKQFHESSSTEALLNGLFYGIMILTIVFSFLLLFGFASLTEKTNYIILGILILFTLWNANFDGIAFQYLWPSSPWISKFGMFSFPLIGLIFMSLFSDDFNDKRLSSIMLYNIKIIFSVFIVLFLIYCLIYHPQLILIHITSIVLGLIMICVTFFSWYHQIRKQPRTAKYYVSLFIIIILWLILIVLKIFTNFFSPDFFNIAFKFILSAMAFTLTTAVISRMKYRYSEIYKETLQKLDSELVEKTRELEFKSKEVSIVNDELSIANEHIIKQIEELKHKNSLLENSFNYAQSIQNALLPDTFEFIKNKKSIFVLNKPKDIISGDIYLMEQINEVLYVAVVDCSGQGMQGAILSILVQNKLLSIINSVPNILPCEILSSFQKEFHELFKNKDVSHIDNETIHIGILSINENNKTLYYSGMQMPIYIVRKNELIQLKGETESITISNYIDTFKQENFTIEQNDTIYITTNGYANQFNSKSERFKRTNLKALLLDINKMSMMEQKKELERQHEDWKGSTPQTDDILVLGIKLE